MRGGRTKGEQRQGGNGKKGVCVQVVRSGGEGWEKEQGRKKAEQEEGEEGGRRKEI